MEEDDGGSFNVVLLGDSDVGKTNLLSRFTRNQFTDDTSSTVGVEYASYTMQINGQCVKTQIWDTAGLERYRALTRTYYRGAYGALLVYDITRAETFENAKTVWLGELKQNADPDVVTILVGNKKDLSAEREVSTEMGIAFAAEANFSFMETSAKQPDVEQENQSPRTWGRWGGRQSEAEEEGGDTRCAFEGLITEIYHRISGEDVLDEDLARVQQDMAETKTKKTWTSRLTGNNSDAQCSNSLDEDLARVRVQRDVQEAKRKTGGWKLWH